MTPSASPPTLGSREWALLLLLGLVWGASFFFKILVAALPPFTVVFGRLAIAAVAMTVIGLASRHRRSAT